MSALHEYVAEQQHSTEPPWARQPGSVFTLAASTAVAEFGRSANTSMPSKPHTFPEIKAMLVTFDMMPRSDDGVVQMVRHDLSRMKNIAKQKRALAECDAYRVWRSEKTVRIEFLDMSKPEESRIRFRMIYDLIPPLR